MSQTDLVELKRKKTHTNLVEHTQYESNTAAVAVAADDFSCVRKRERNEHTNEYETNAHMHDEKAFSSTH